MQILNRIWNSSSLIVVGALATSSWNTRGAHRPTTAMADDGAASASIGMTDEDRRAEKMRALTERQQSRQAEIGKLRAERLDGADPRESAHVFAGKFKSLRLEVEVAVKDARAFTERQQLTATFDVQLKRIRELQGYLSDSVRFLPSYDVQQSQKQVDMLTQLVTATMDELMPKKKFAFKARRQRVATEPKKERANISATPIAAATTDSKLVVSSEPGGVVRLGSAEVEGKDVEICDLRDCRVEMAGQPNVFHIRGLANCTVLVGPVSRSLLISDCSQCRFWIACQQLRVHTTTETDFYLHVTSKAIIEDCSAMRFAPYNWKYPNLDDDYTASGLDRSRNSWDAVDDFKWLNPNAPSPNWSVLPEADRAAP